MKFSATLCLVLLLTVAASTYAQTCSGDTPIEENGECVACTSDSQCWAISSNTLVCNTTSGACGNCTSSASCSEDLPICSSTTSTCTACNATAECAARLSGSVCQSDTGLCGWCTSDAECAVFSGYGSSSKCQNITTGVRKCSVPSPGAAAGADPNNINGIITAYVIICIVLLVLFVMFVACGTFHQTHQFFPSLQNLLLISAKTAKKSLSSAE